MISARNPIYHEVWVGSSRKSAIILTSAIAYLVLAIAYLVLASAGAIIIASARV